MNEETPAVRLSHCLLRFKKYYGWLQDTMFRHRIAQTVKIQFWTYRTIQTELMAMCAETKCLNGRHGRALQVAKRRVRAQALRIACHSSVMLAGLRPQ